MQRSMKPPWRRTRKGKGKKDEGKGKNAGSSGWSCWAPRGWKEGRDEPRPSKSSASHEVVTIEDNANEAPEFTTDKPSQLWRDVLGLQAEDEKGARGPLGLPRFMRENLEASLSDMNMEETNLMLASFMQLQSLVMAQVSALIQARIRELAAERPNEAEEDQMKVR